MKADDVVARETGRAKVTMEWEVDVDYLTTEGGGIRASGWIADPEAVIAQCTSDSARVLTIDRIS